MECRNCGVQLNEDAKFCKNCGSKIEREEELSTVEGEFTDIEEGKDKVSLKEDALKSKKNDKVSSEEEMEQLEEQFGYEKRAYYNKLEELGVEQKELRKQIKKWKTDIQMLRTESYMIQSGRKISDKKSVTGKIYIGRIVDTDIIREPQGYTEPQMHKNISSTGPDFWITVAAGIIITLVVLFAGWLKIYGNSLPIYKVASTLGDIIETGNAFADAFQTEGMPGIVSVIYLLGILGCCIPIPYWIYIYQLAVKKDEQCWRVLALIYNFLICSLMFLVILTIKYSISSTMSEYGEIGELFGSTASGLVEFGAALFVIPIVGIVEWLLTRNRNTAEILGKSETGTSERVLSVAGIEIPVLNFNPSLRFRIPSVVIEKSSQGRSLSLKIGCYAEGGLESLLGTVDFIDNFGEVYRLEECRMNTNRSEGQLQTNNIPFVFEQFPIDSIRYAEVYIEKYIIDSVVYECTEPFYESEMSFQELIQYRKRSGDNTAAAQYSKNVQGWICTCGVLNMEQDEKCWNCTRKQEQHIF